MVNLWKESSPGRLRAPRAFFANKSERIAQADQRYF
jgi:hypothetical protein